MGVFGHAGGQAPASGFVQFTVPAGCCGDDHDEGGGIGYLSPRRPSVTGKRSMGCMERECT